MALFGLHQNLPHTHTNCSNALQHYGKVFDVDIEPHYKILNGFLIFLLVLHIYWRVWVVGVCAEGRLIPARTRTRFLRARGCVSDCGRHVPG